ncbi:hypothetical protein HDU96_010927 [Phlyctochytrium bullatum]|nr:hypothetical protein HDU96_010927 [Phlyctochytrium bullatum]
MTVTALTKLFHKYRNNIDTGKKILDNAKFPRPVHVLVKKTYIPRRGDVLPAGMNPEDATGNLKAEYVDADTNADLSKPAKRVILYAHGGVYVMCSRKTHRAVTWRLAKYADARVLSRPGLAAIDYRLAPHHKFPTPINDMVSAYLHLVDPPADSNLPRYRPDQIVFMGDSAGGNLCMAAMLYLRQSGKAAVPAGLGLLCPWLDLTHSSPSFVFNGAHDFLPTGSADPKYILEGQVHYYVPPNVEMDDPLVSPYYSKDSEPGQPSTFPQILIQVGGAERLRDESISFYAERCPESNIQLEVYEDMIHVWHLFAPVEPISRVAIKRLASFAVSVTGPTATPLDRKATLIRNRTGFPAEPFDDPLAHLERERARLRAVLLAREGDAGAEVPEEPDHDVVVMVEVEEVEVEGVTKEEVPENVVANAESNEVVEPVAAEVVPVADAEPPAAATDAAQPANTVEEPVKPAAAESAEAAAPSKTEEEPAAPAPAEIASSA